MNWPDEVDKYLMSHMVYSKNKHAEILRSRYERINSTLNMRNLMTWIRPEEYKTAFHIVQSRAVRTKMPRDSPLWLRAETEGDECAALVQGFRNIQGINLIQPFLQEVNACSTSINFNFEPWLCPFLIHSIIVPEMVPEMMSYFEMILSNFSEIWGIVGIIPEKNTLSGVWFKVTAYIWDP